MQAAGIEPTVISYSALMRAYTHGNQAEKGILLFEHMCVNGIMPDHVTYSTMFHLCEKTGNGQRTIALFDRMMDEFKFNEGPTTTSQEQDVDVRLYTTLIRAWAKSSEIPYESTVSLVRLVQKRLQEMSIDYENRFFYDAACLVCKLAGNDEEYQRYRSEMKEKGIAYYSEHNEEERVEKYRRGGVNR